MPSPDREWQIGRRRLAFGNRTLVMGILNVTPDSFSDGGQFLSRDEALARAEQIVAEGADIIDVGGESTRPGAGALSSEEELDRVLPVIESLVKELPIPISVDTTKSEVARAALNAGAEIVNDISGLRFDYRIADEVASAGAGIILMHSRGTPATMHRLPPAPDVLSDVTAGLRRGIAMAERRGVSRESIALDPGIGFGKAQEQNVELVAKLGQVANTFEGFPIIIGTSRKSFIGWLLDGTPVVDRIYGTLATVVASVLQGAHIVRVHDVRAAIDAVRVTDAIRLASRT